MEGKKRIGLTDLFMLVVSILYLVLMLTLFKACGAKEDGSFMTCHWAHQTLLVSAASCFRGCAEETGYCHCGDRGMFCRDPDPGAHDRPLHDGRYALP